MSDLHCAATLLVARHGEAEYDSDLLSDAGGSLTLQGRKQARELGRALAGRRVAYVYCSGMARAVQTAEIAAAELAVPVGVREGLHEWRVGDLAGRRYVPGMYDEYLAAWGSGDLATRIPGGESGAEIRDRVADELQTVADAHRGETVLVVSHGGAVRVAVPQLARGLPPDYGSAHELDHCDVVEVLADADGWAVRSWAGAGLR